MKFLNSNFKKYEKHSPFAILEGDFSLLSGCMILTV